MRTKTKLIKKWKELPKMRRSISPTMEWGGDGKLLWKSITRPVSRSQGAYFQKYMQKKQQQENELLAVKMPLT